VGGDPVMGDMISKVRRTCQICGAGEDVAELRPGIMVRPAIGELI